MKAQRSINWVEQGYVPDTIVRKGIRQMLKKRLGEIHANDIEKLTALKHSFINEMKQSPIAITPDKANEQHYEVPAEFYEHVLGNHKKYSCCYWSDETNTLTEAEENALRITCQRAEIKNGHKILELGCGWGSLTIWIAMRFPNCNITAVSNSHSQKNHILERARQLQLTNITVITSDMNDFDTDEQFDRVVSIEMFEHMRNWELLYKKVSNWLIPEGKFFMHVFTHCRVPYAFEIKDSSDWMSEYFFTGGMMPSHDLPLYFQGDMNLENTWTWDGSHYAKTSNEWLYRMDNNKEKLLPVLESTYGEDFSNVWWNRWRLFFMACEELFAFNNGQEWHVSHYLFTRNRAVD
jgi:cyclopropane-fatty-acyl-phospholipid synthase